MSIKMESATNELNATSNNIPVEDISYIAEDIVVDRYNLCQIFAFYFGVCSLFPWNCLLITDNFFKTKVDNGKGLKCIYTSTFTSCSNTATVLTFIVNLVYLHKYNRSIRAYVALSMMLVGFVILLAFVSVDTQKFAKGFFAIVILCVIFLAVASTVGQATFFATFAYFPPKYIGIFFTGQAFSGLVAVGLQLIAKSTNLDVNSSAYVFFGLCLAFVTFAIISYWIFVRTRYYKQTMKAAQRHQNINVNTNRETIPFRRLMMMYYRILLKVFPQASTIFFTFFVTLFLFPVLPLKWSTSSTNAEWEKYFTLVTVFLMFNLGDTLGRLFSRYFQWPKGNTVVLPVFSVIRLLFFFPFVMCHLKSNTEYTAFPKWFKSDAFPIVLMFLFSFTNGYYPSIGFTSTYKAVNPDEAEYCNNLLVLLLGVGLSLGSFLSFVLQSKTC